MVWCVYCFDWLFFVIHFPFLIFVFCCFHFDFKRRYEVVWIGKGGQIWKELEEIEYNQNALYEDKFKDKEGEF